MQWRCIILSACIWDTIIKTKFMGMKLGDFLNSANDPLAYVLAFFRSS